MGNLNRHAGPRVEPRFDRWLHVALFEEEITRRMRTFEIRRESQPEEQQYAGDE